ncbi:MAG: hypothetical protein HXX20_05165 [Chloroflexi bacterium]|nr:hypothetical protein [Chloroflexota bacterium]
MNFSRLTTSTKRLHRIPLLLVPLIVTLLLMSACGEVSPTSTASSQLTATPTFLPVSRVAPPTLVATSVVVPTVAPATTLPTTRVAVTATPAPRATVGPLSALPTIQANLGTAFSLKINQVAQVAPDNLEVKLLRVVEDSRCPSNVNCAWSGQIVVEVAVSKNGQAMGKFMLNSTETYRYKERPFFENYNLAVVQAQPIPYYENFGSSNSQIKPINPEDYIVNILVTKLATGIVSADQALLGQRVQLKYGQVATFAKEGLALKFEALVSEFRCPKSANVACATSGEATVRIVGTKEQVTRSFELTIPGLTIDTTQLNAASRSNSFVENFEGYRVQLVSLEPQPTEEAGKPSIEAYTLLLLVTSV